MQRSFGHKRKRDPACKRNASGRESFQFWIFLKQNSAVIFSDLGPWHSESIGWHESIQKFASLRLQAWPLLSSNTSKNKTIQIFDPGVDFFKKKILNYLQ